MEFPQLCFGFMNGVIISPFSQHGQIDALWIFVNYLGNMEDE